jgi:oxygen-independent coproporphyrinogen-3 oxidase
LVGLFDSGKRCYSTYPSPEHFATTFRAKDYRTAVGHRGAGNSRPLSLQVCFPQGGSSRQRGEYERCLSGEIVLQARLFAEDPRVQRMALQPGGATREEVNMLPRLLSRIDDSFEVERGSTYSIEVMPWVTDQFSMKELRQIGFNQVSLAAWDRSPQSSTDPGEDLETTLLQIGAARQAGFQVVNLDLAYGRHGQTLVGFDGTLSKVLVAMPHRIALKDFSRSPAISMARLRDLPSAELRLALFAHAVSKLTAAGYVRLGMGQFVLAEDPWALAQRHGHLYWGARGYSTGDDGDSVGLGVSALGAVGPTYCRNGLHLRRYRESVISGEPPITSGLRLTHDDLLRRAIIRALVCNLEVSTHTLEVAYLIDFARYFARELGSLAEFEALGLIELEKGRIRVTQHGRLLLRSICMTFDRYLRPKG